MLFEIQSISSSDGPSSGDRARPTFGRKNDGKEKERREGRREGGSERRRGTREQ